MLIIDRFEGEFTVVETSEGMVNIPRADIPSNAEEGDILVFSIDALATETRKKRVGEMMSNIFKG